MCTWTSAILDFFLFSSILDFLELCSLAIWVIVTKILSVKICKFVIVVPENGVQDVIFKIMLTSHKRYYIILWFFKHNFSGCYKLGSTLIGLWLSFGIPCISQFVKNKPVFATIVFHGTLITSQYNIMVTLRPCNGINNSKCLVINIYFSIFQQMQYITP